MSLPDSAADALPEGDLRHSHPVSATSRDTNSPSAFPPPSRPDYATMVMVASGMSRSEIRAEARGGIGGGQYGQDEDTGLDYFAGRVRR